jgi:hypothetical protein
MQGNNEWASHCADYIETELAADRHEIAKKALKELVPADASKCFGHGIIISATSAARFAFQRENNMNQQVAVYEPRPQAPAQTFTMSEMERIALAIAKGRLFGSDDPNAVLTLCMVAQAEGKHPGLVMQQYHIIKGKPAKKAEAMLVDFLAAGGRVTWNKLDDECADATFSHPQGGEVTINWTMARATKAGLLNNDTWKKYPRQMLRSRVVSEGVRTVYPGATSGMYVPEEVQDFDEN